MEIGTRRRRPRAEAEMVVPLEVIDSTGGGEWTRTTDLRIMSASTPTENKGDQQLSSAECGKSRQNAHAPRK